MEADGLLSLSAMYVKLDTPKSSGIVGTQTSCLAVIILRSEFAPPAVLCLMLRQYLPSDPVLASTTASQHASTYSTGMCSEVTARITSRVQ